MDAVVKCTPGVLRFVQMLLHRFVTYRRNMPCGAKQPSPSAVAACLEPWLFFSTKLKIKGQGKAWTIA